MIEKLQQWIEEQKEGLYAEIEEIEDSDEPDSLVSSMTEVELIELKIELLDSVLSQLFIGVIET